MQFASGAILERFLQSPERVTGSISARHVRNRVPQQALDSLMLPVDNIRFANVQMSREGTEAEQQSSGAHVLSPAMMSEPAAQSPIHAVYGSLLSKVVTVAVAATFAYPAPETVPQLSEIVTSSGVTTMQAPQDVDRAVVKLRQIIRAQNSGHIAALEDEIHRRVGVSALVRVFKDLSNDVFLRAEAARFFVRHVLESGELSLDPLMRHYLRSLATSNRSFERNSVVLGAMDAGHIAWVRRFEDDPSRSVRESAEEALERFEDQGLV